MHIDNHAYGNEEVKDERLMELEELEDIDYNQPRKSSGQLVEAKMRRAEPRNVRAGSRQDFENRQRLAREIWDQEQA